MSNSMHPIKDIQAEQIIIFENATFWTDKSDVLHCKFNNSNSNSKLDYRQVNLFIKAIDKLCNGKPMPFLIDVRNARGTFSIAAARLIANSPQLIKLRISEAFVVNTIAIRVLITAYKRLYNPLTPFGVFNDVEPAKLYCLDEKTKFYECN